MDSFQRPFRFLPSLKKKTVIILYNVVIWALIVLITITAIGVTTYDQIKIIHWVTYLAGALLVPLFVNSHPRELPEITAIPPNISLPVQSHVLQDNS